MKVTVRSDNPNKAMNPIYNLTSDDIDYMRIGDLSDLKACTADEIRQKIRDNISRARDPDTKLRTAIIVHPCMMRLFGYATKSFEGVEIATSTEVQKDIVFMLVRSELPAQITSSRIIPAQAGNNMTCWKAKASDVPTFLDFCALTQIPLTREVESVAKSLSYGETTIRTNIVIGAALMRYQQYLCSIKTDSVPDGMEDVTYLYAAIVDSDPHNKLSPWIHREFRNCPYRNENKGKKVLNSGKIEVVTSTIDASDRSELLGYTRLCAITDVSAPPSVIEALQTSLATVRKYGAGFYQGLLILVRP